MIVSYSVLVPEGYEIGDEGILLKVGIGEHLLINVISMFKTKNYSKFYAFFNIVFFHTLMGYQKFHSY